MDKKMITDNDLNNYLKYLDEEIKKSNDFGKKCIDIDKDYKAAEKWFSIAEAFTVAKEKAIEIMKKIKT